MLTALIAEQSALIGLEIRQGLEAAGIVVLDIVTDGAAAVERALALRPSLITIDLVLPRLSGLQVVAAIRRHGLVHTKVVVISAVSAQASIIAAKEAGVCGYVLKPVARNRLRELGMSLAQHAPPLAQAAR
jgi:DNA-binding response OmpR family regulator